MHKLEQSQTLLEKRIKQLEAAPSTAASPQGETRPETAPPAVSRSTHHPVEHTSAALPGNDTKAGIKENKKREQQVAAIPVPDTGNAMEDNYTYAFRLFEAKLYPESEAKLDEFIAAYPHTKRYSYAQNLLGRAYFEEGKYPNAAKAFVENYTTMPKGERAAESLSWAGFALIRAGSPAKACRVYHEFDDVYGSRAAHDIILRVEQGRKKAQCPTG
ncbi:MAG: hypothetical protein KGJ05_05410 [Alphaproteobacteria bacterium]|nr:hypothetical protein [Alphaproteobacteria bacterium]